MTSSIAEIALYLSIPLMVGIFFVLRPVVATVVIALGAEMFLPEGPNIKLPLTPPFDKHTLPYLCILIACLIRSPARVTKPPKEMWVTALAILLVVGGVATSLTNTDSMIFGDAGQVYVAGLTIKDGFYLGLSGFTQTFLPFYIGYSLFRKHEDMEKLLAGLAVAGLVYIPFALVELRLSPQWHRWVFGYAQHDFNQTIRWGGYRPMVFMSHGLALARFFTAATFALIILAKVRKRLLGISMKFLSWTQLIVLVACKSTGAILFAIIGAPLLALSKPKRQLLVAVILAWGTLLYPLLRLSGLFPASSFVNAAASVQTERGDSLEFRFLNEDAVLAHTRDRIAFGWGLYNRNVIHEKWSGKPTSTLDGHWLICVSATGLNGFFAAFVPLLLPVVIVRRRLSWLQAGTEQRVVAGLAFTVAILALDLIPNGLWGVYPYLLAGALTRRMREAKAEAQERRALLQQA